ncbi:MAG: DUF4412 domain-containing protein [Bacteroidetes bacterium]|nr:DUF4412 domain-containing protein [Bacteroidota bacterium]
MNIKKSILCLMTLGLISQGLQAQFLKKLKKKVEDKVEETIIEKSSDEAAKKTDQSLDKIFNPDFGSTEAKEVNKEDIPEIFEFDYKYQLKLTSSKSDMKIDYFLKPGASYLGSKPDVGSEMFMVLDGNSNTNYMFMDMGGTKICKTTSLNSGNLESNSNQLEDYKITELPNKTFLGYNCEGIKMENDEYEFMIYYTNEAKVSFNDVFKTNPEQIPSSMKGFFDENQNALMMYMDMKDKKNNGRKNISSTMECTLLEPTSLKVRTSQYKIM